jgi:hypothetical protein
LQSDKTIAFIGFYEGWQKWKAFEATPKNADVAAQQSGFVA